MFLFQSVIYFSYNLLLDQSSWHISIISHRWATFGLLLEYNFSFYILVCFDDWWRQLTVISLKSVVRLC